MDTITINRSHRLLLLDDLIRCPRSSAPSKPKAARNNGPKNVSYRVLGNEVSGNTGDHTGVFNVGNKNTGRHMEDDDEDEE